MSIKPIILLTNDDGIEALGLWHLWHALHEIAELFIVAPTQERSGASLGLTLHRPLTIHPVKWEGETSAWKISGTPADCVRFGLRLLLNKKPDLIVSGINRGSNAGRNVLHSGTIGGVIEGALKGFPGIAFSCEDFDEPDYKNAEPYIGPIVQHILEHTLTPGTILNVNFPHHGEAIKGLRLARQGRGLWVEDPDERLHPGGNPYFWHGGRWDTHEEHEESDVALLQQGYIAAVPIQVDQLTDHNFLELRRTLFNSLPLPA
ncbi:MAG: 5'-nucleotidase SurE [Chlamydiae bacterium]|nr:5'-nucleotidase SurE [Chlamydiota bacterium]